MVVWHKFKWVLGSEQLDNHAADGDFVTVLGDITMKDEGGKAANYSYCDIWRFRGSKIVK